MIGVIACWHFPTGIIPSKDNEPIILSPARMLVRSGCSRLVIAGDGSGYLRDLLEHVFGIGVWSFKVSQPEIFTAMHESTNLNGTATHIITYADAYYDETETCFNAPGYASVRDSSGKVAYDFERGTWTMDRSLSHRMAGWFTYNERMAEGLAGARGGLAEKLNAAQIEAVNVPFAIKNNLRFSEKYDDYRRYSVST